LRKSRIFAGNKIKSILDSNRQKKVGKLFQEELSEVFRKEAKELYPGNIITVSEVTVSPDLSVAKVYISIFPNTQKEFIVKEIKAKAPTYRSMLAKTAAKTMRITPELLFYVDNSLDNIEKIERAIRGEGENPII